MSRLSMLKRAAEYGGDSDWDVLSSLSSHGGAWLYGYPLTGESVIEIVGGYVDSTSASYTTFIGGAKQNIAGTRRDRCLFSRTPQNQEVFYYSDSSVIIPDDPTTDTRTVRWFEKGGVVLINGVEVARTGSSMVGKVPQTIALFGLLLDEVIAGVDSVVDYCNYRIERYRVYSDDTLSSVVADYRPRRQISTGQIGLYDLVTGTFHTNQNSVGYFYAG